MTYDPNNKAEKPKARRPGGKTKRWPGKWMLRIFRGYDVAGKRDRFQMGALQASSPQNWIESREDYRQMGKAMSA